MIIRTIKQKLLLNLYETNYISKHELITDLPISESKLKQLIYELNQIPGINIETKAAKGYYLKTNFSKLELNNLNLCSNKLNVEELIELNLLLNQNFIKLETVAKELFISYSKVYAEVQKLKQNYQIVNKKGYGFKLVIDPFIRKINIIKILEKHINSIDIEQDIINIFRELGFEVVDVYKKAIKYLAQNCFNIKSTLLINAILMYILESIITVCNPSDDKQLINQLGMIIDQSSENYFQAFLKVEIKTKEIRLSDIFSYLETNQGITYGYSQEEYLDFERHVNGLIKRNQDVFLPVSKYELIREFKLKYPIACISANLTHDYLNSVCNIKLNDLEILYLAIHFQKLSRNNTCKIKVIIVCEFGYAMSSLIAKELLERFNNIDIVTLLSFNEFLLKRDFYLNQVDIIITTLSGTLDKRVKTINIDYVNYLASFKMVEQTIDEIRKKKFIELIIDNAVILNQDLKCQKDCFKWLASFIKVNQLATNSYVKSVEKRANHGNVVHNHICYLHGNNAEILKNKFVLVKLDHEFMFNNQKVKWLYLVFVTKEVIEVFNQEVSKLYQITINEKFDNKLQAVKQNNIKEFLIKELNRKD